MVKKNTQSSTQRYLDISAIHDDVVVTRDGALRAVIMSSSINFALKSEEEQNALVSAYASFLNLLEFPIQIVIQSRKLNIDGYLNQLKQSEREQTNELLKLQIADYQVFIKELVEMGEIMSKKFFVVVPYSALSNKKKSFFSRLSEVLTPAFTVSLQRARFLEKKKDLMSRVEQVIGQLQSMGLNSVMLDTQGLIELYYNTYNPEISETEKVMEMEKVQVE